MAFDAAQARADKAARIARGEAKVPAAVSIEPLPLPVEAFRSISAEMLVPEPTPEAAPEAKPLPADKPSPTTWARLARGLPEIAEE